ncbi:MAG: low molecular weight protein-tyrosine-phosphatase [Bacteroidales bacterium]
MDTKLLFVCLGNICRSPSAQGIMEKLIDDRKMTSCISVDSAGTYGGHQGELPDSRMRAHARKRGYELTHRSRQVKRVDFETFDLIIAMDDRNYHDLMELAPDLESQAKIRRMVEFSDNLMHDHVPDPYYSGADGFELVLDILEDACKGLLEELIRRK